MNYEVRAVSNKFALVLALAAFAFAGQVADPTSEFKDGEGWYYAGNLGNQEIGLAITGSTGSRICGHYFYWHYLRDIALVGEISGPRDIALYENDKQGATRAKFSLHLAETDPDFKGRQLTIDRLVGRWESPEKTFDVRLKLKYGLGPDGHLYAVAGGKLSDEQIEANIRRFYWGVVKGDRQQVASSMNYPLTINSKPRKLVHSKRELLAKYDLIFTPALVSHLEKNVPHDLFANWQGIMIADGAVWFDGNGFAKVINPD